MEGSLALLEVDRCKICAVSSMYLYTGCGGSEGPCVCRCTSTSSCSVTNFDDALEYLSMSASIMYLSIFTDAGMPQHQPQSLGLVH